MLGAYISTLKACHKRSDTRGENSKSLNQCDEALKSPENALTTFREAQTQPQNGDLDSVMRALKCTTGDHLHTPLIFSVQELCQRYTKTRSYECLR